MSNRLTETAITRAIRGSVELAKSGTPQQRAGMFKPDVRDGQVAGKEIPRNLDKRARSAD